MDLRPNDFRKWFSKSIAEGSGDADSNLIWISPSRLVAPAAEKKIVTKVQSLIILQNFPSFMTCLFSNLYTLFTITPYDDVLLEWEKTENCTNTNRQTDYQKTKEVNKETNCYCKPGSN